MKKRKKKWVTPAALFAVLAVLLVAYEALAAANRKAEEKAAAEAAKSEEVEMIAEYDYSTAAALSYTVNGETLSFEKDNGTWYYTGDKKFPLNQDILESMAGAISSIGVTRSIDEGEAGDYGLDEPAYTITVKYSGDIQREYKIGDRNSFNGEYYFMTGSRIYMISDGLLSYFDYTLDDLLVTDSYPTDIETDYITSISVNTGEERYTIDDAEEISDLYTYVRQLNFASVADYYSENMAEEYGIDGTKGITVNYRRSVTSTAEDGTGTATRIDAVYSVYFGDTVSEEDGSVYYTVRGSDMVYTMSAGLYENIVGSAAEPLPEEEE